MDESSIQPPGFGEALYAAYSLKVRDFITGILTLKVRHLFDDNWIYAHDRSVKVGRIQNFRARAGRETLKARSALLPPLGTVTEARPLCLLTASYSLPTVPTLLDSSVGARSGRPLRAPAP